MGIGALVNMHVRCRNGYMSHLGCSGCSATDANLRKVIGTAHPCLGCKFEFSTWTNLHMLIGWSVTPPRMLSRLHDLVGSVSGRVHKWLRFTHRMSCRIWYLSCHSIDEHWVAKFLPRMLGRMHDHANFAY